MTLSIGRHHEESIIIINYETLEATSIMMDAREIPYEHRGHANYRFRIDAPPHYLVFRRELAMNAGVCRRCDACRGSGKVQHPGVRATCGLCCGSGVTVERETLELYLEAKNVLVRTKEFLDREPPPAPRRTFPDAAEMSRDLVEGSWNITDAAGSVLPGTSLVKNAGGTYEKFAPQCIPLPTLIDQAMSKRGSDE